MQEETIVRKNLMEQKDYTPYCGAERCHEHMPRTTWDESKGQFTCTCGWISDFPEDFIKRYKEFKAQPIMQDKIFIEEWLMDESRKKKVGEKYSFYELVELAKAWASIKVGEQACGGWVKANGRLPDYSTSVHIKVHERPGFGKFYEQGGKKMLGFESVNGFGTLEEEHFADVSWLDESLLSCAAYEILKEENAKLKTVMIAAAEEIKEHWAAHCDKEGYGPSSLMRRLEEGIPSGYGYTAGRFEEMKKEIEGLKVLGNDCVKTINDKTKTISQLEGEIEQFKNSIKITGIAFEKEKDRLKGLVWEAWQQSIDNCEIENGAGDPEFNGKFTSRKQFKINNNL